MDVVIGCDVGGTSIKAGLFSPDGELLARRSAATPALVDEAAYAVVTDLLASMVAEAGADSVVGVGIDTPGAVRADGTHLLHYNIDIDVAGLRAAVSRAFPGAATCVMNDGNAAAAGELWQGSGRGTSTFCHLVLGTGVGSGVVCGGQVLAGAHGCAGEIGHMCVNPEEERRCTCGRRGCTELYASATGIMRSYREECERTGAEARDLSRGAVAVLEAYVDGEPAAAFAVEAMCEMLGRCLATTASVLDPDAFVIGGGVSAGFDVFGDLLRERYRAHASEGCEDTSIVAASLGNDAGIYGAAYGALRLV